MEINEELLRPHLLFNSPFRYNEYITLSPVRMKDYIDFSIFSTALTLRKDAIFQEKKLIKMGYFEFIKYSFRNFELAKKYEENQLPYYYDFIVGLLQIICGQDAKILYNSSNLDLYINDFLITDEVFDDLRKIIIIQNDIDFNIDEFMNIDTVNALEKARAFEAEKNKQKANIEDYIDSIVISLRVDEEYVSNITIRKFWRYVKRINKHESYNARLTGEMGGFVKFKEPLEHWMTTLDVEDKYENLKTNESELRSKVEG